MARRHGKGLACHRITSVADGVSVPSCQKHRPRQEGCNSLCVARILTALVEALNPGYISGRECEGEPMRIRLTVAALPGLIAALCVHLGCSWSNGAGVGSGGSDKGAAGGSDSGGVSGGPTSSGAGTSGGRGGASIGSGGATSGSGGAANGGAAVRTPAAPSAAASRVAALVSPAPGAPRLRVTSHRVMGASSHSKRFGRCQQRSTGGHGRSP